MGGGGEGEGGRAYIINGCIRGWDPAAQSTAFAYILSLLSLVLLLLFYVPYILKGSQLAVFGGTMHHLNNVCVAEQATRKRRFLFWLCHFIYSHSSAKLSSKLMELLDVGNLSMRELGLMSCIYTSAAVILIVVICNLYVKVAVIRNPVIQ